MGVRNHAADCYTCSATAQRPAASLWFQARGADELYVSNIVPRGKPDLTDEEYNAILVDFQDAVLSPAMDCVQVQVEMVLHRAVLDGYLSPEAIRRLDAFSVAADKNGLHPEDCRRWREFVIQCHREEANLDTGVLDQWLEDREWGEDERRELVCEYETARSVLETYDEERLDKCLP